MNFNCGTAAAGSNSAVKESKHVSGALLGTSDQSDGKKVVNPPITGGAFRSLSSSLDDHCKSERPFFGESVNDSAADSSSIDASNNHLSGGSNLDSFFTLRGKRTKTMHHTNEAVSKKNDRRNVKQMDVGFGLFPPESIATKP